MVAASSVESLVSYVAPDEITIFNDHVIHPSALFDIELCIEFVGQARV